MSLANLIMLFVILIGLGIIYNRMEAKRLENSEHENYSQIKKYLLNDSTLAKSKKTILWIHVTYEYNSRQWSSFGSRSSTDLNQPYLYLTVKSIIKHCDNSFNICMIDDSTFAKLIPGWTINMNTITDPILGYVRQMGMAKLLYYYGGITVPVSFVCTRNLLGMYEKGTRNHRMFICENIDSNITVTSYKFYPDSSFMGSTKENETLKEFIDFIQRIISTDQTAQTEFLGEMNRWINHRVNLKKINLIYGHDIGIKDMDDEPILLDDMLSNNYINIYENAYGIYIPAKQILNRVHYEWFARQSAKQVLEGNSIISKYLLLANTPNSNAHVVESMQKKPNWVSFWQVPSGVPVWGLKPNNLGDRVRRMKD